MNGLGLPWEELEQTIKVRRWRYDCTTHQYLVEMSVGVMKSFVMKKLSLELALIKKVLKLIVFG